MQDGQTSMASPLSESGGKGPQAADSGRGVGGCRRRNRCMTATGSLASSLASVDL